MSKVKIEAGDQSGSFSAYLAEPAGDGPAPGLIVILEIRGVNANLRRICDEYAARGYLAIAPDLLWRLEADLDYDPDTPAGWEKAMKLNAGFDEDLAVEDLITTLGWLRRHPRSNGIVGALGYCLGGKLAYYMATRSDADAAVGYYGVGIEKKLAETRHIAKPLMLHLAGDDRFVPPEAQREIVAGLADVRDAEVHIYPGTDHAFARKDGVRYAPEAAALADSRTMAFLDKALKGS
jgi:carboxymethylenebutenolidase